jgi:hypothetical protein
MSIDGWFPRLRNDGVLASGSKGIWITPLDGPPALISTVGLRPVWAAQALVYSRDNGTSQVGVETVPTAYNEYTGSDFGQWAGFYQVGLGRVDLWNNRTLVRQIPGACAPRFVGAALGYLTPYAANTRSLVIDGIARTTAVIVEWCADRGGAAYAYTIANGVSTRRIFDSKGNDCTIRAQQDETAIVMFIGLDGHPWIVSWTPAMTFVRMIYSAFGYVFPGDFLNADARMIGARAHVVGSLTNGEPRSAWIDFSVPMVDLRKV